MQSVRAPVGLAWIGQPTLGWMIAEAEKTSPSETGGALVGYWVANYTEVVITDAIGPGPLAVHKEHRFIPDFECHCEQIALLYEQSGRLHTYLGDWHTHPDGTLFLGRQDRSTLKRIASHTPARAPVPLMAVLARQNGWILQVWCFFPRRTYSFWRSRILPFELRVTN